MKVLVPIEDDFVAEAQTDFIASYKWPDDTEIGLVHVLHTLMVERSMVSSQVYLDKLMKEALLDADKVMTAIEAKIKIDCPELYVSRSFLEGSAVEQILDMAESWSADMILLCSHGREGIAQLVLGSVSYNVLVHSPCKVIILGLPHDSRQKSDPRSWKDAHMQVTLR
ncbi:MAG: universal stress protein [Candidatus Obscuribacterales bacterium]|nr:universal stress protein [Candidatus Obscuribacterales bacterium]